MALLVWLGAIYFKQYRLQMQYTADVERTYQVIITLRNIEEDLLNAETRQRGYLLTGLEHFKGPYYNSVARVDSIIKELRPMIVDNPKQRVNLKLLEPAIAQRTGLLEANLYLQKNAPDFVERLDKGEQVMNKIRVYIKAMADEEYALLAWRSREKNRYQKLNTEFRTYTFGFAAFVFMCSILMIIRELKTRVRTQKMLEKSVFELRQSNEEIEQVSFAASHDLQEPLRKIRTLSTLLSKKYSDRLPSDEKDIITRIDRSTERMHMLLKNLIDFTNLAGHPEKISQVNLDSLFARVFMKMSEGAEISLHKKVTLPLVEGYEEQLSLLFSQILSNALRYRHPGRPLVIDVRCETRKAGNKKFWKRNRERDYHAITIEDNGIGFEKVYNEKVFGLFQRLHNQTEYEGQGIGLTIARRIMTNHYGFIEAEGKKGEGAAFTLYFPFQ